MGGRGSPAPPSLGRNVNPLPRPRTFRERFGALRNLPPFLMLVWQTSRALTIGSLLLRLVRAVLPVVTLYVGKLIIDEVVAGLGAPNRPTTLQGWWESGLLDRLLLYIAAEFALAVLSDVSGRVVSLFDALLSEKFSNTTSVQLMEHAATLDLEDFEDSELQDKLDRARRQASGRMTLITQLFGQAQDIVTIASFAAGLFVFAPWLIVLLLVALVPAFLGEAYFNAQGYALMYARTPEQRELDYVRQTGASVETAKEVKIFGLNAFLISRYRELATGFYNANKRLAIRRATWGGVFTAFGTMGYYAAYGWLAWRTLAGQWMISFRSSRSNRKLSHRRMRGRFRHRCARASYSKTLASCTRVLNDGQCVTSILNCMQEKCSRSWAKMVRARQHS